MFDLMPVSLIVAYVLFSTFSFYQKLHISKFRGRSQVFEFFLNLSALMAMICGLAFLVYYGWNVRWYLPILLFILGLIALAIWFMIEALLKVRDLAFIMSMTAFIVWPVAAYFMFRAVPGG